jgi:catechol 2,3-dioxygenase-like lactoylglutathione lyase family enzyme
VGITVSDLDRTVAQYCGSFGLEVVSDAPRSGAFFDTVYKTANAHARLVYLAVNPIQHFELFHFRNPATLAPEPQPGLRPEVQYCLLRLRRRPELSSWDRGSVLEWLEPLAAAEQDRSPGSRLDTVMNKDFYLLSILSSPEGDHTPRLLYPVVVVRSLAAALPFYRDILGLTVDEPIRGDGGESRWALMRAQWGACILLAEPLRRAVQPASEDRWPRPGFTHVAFAVRDIDRFYSALQMKGVQFWFAPQALGVGPHAGGKTVLFSTPDGLVVEMLDSPLIRERAPDGP